MAVDATLNKRSKRNVNFGVSNFLAYITFIGFYTSSMIPRDVKIPEKFSNELETNNSDASVGFFIF